MMMGKTGRRVAVTGGVVVTGILAFMLSQFGLDFGTGGGPGPLDNGSPDQSEQAMRDAVATSTPQASMLPTPPESEKSYPDISEVITIVVVGKGYVWATNDTTPEIVEPITLEEVLARAKETTGNSQGLRARIFHAGSALPSAENELIKALKETGLSDNAILFEQRVIDLK
ncbi:hypothetical protein [Rubinisphaera margarita]|uniref:hypothetical protein n=1 Tax=Rubinisphaera margarita TaxID=2909586 RepID=UPI001EE7F46E|nr:hypothetical protein [Rubinisphaera margarita]MCG6157807.1 hypothetical protein [Rubinisphaera margarita]